jgi:hypothetical protein
MRRHKLTRDEVLGIVAAENRRGEDPEGNPIYVKEVRGTLLLAVVALDDGTLITVYDLRT